MASSPADVPPLTEDTPLDSELDSQDVAFFDGQKRKLDELFAESVLDSSTEQLLSDFDRLAPNYEMKVGNVSQAALTALEHQLEEERVAKLRELQEEYKQTLEQIKQAGKRNIDALMKDKEEKKRLIEKEITELEEAHKQSIVDINKAASKFSKELVDELNIQKYKTSLFPKYELLNFFRLPSKHVLNLAIVLKSFRYPAMRLPKGDYAIAVSVMEGVGRTNKNILHTCKVSRVFSYSPPLSGFEDGSPSMDPNLGKPLIVEVPDTPTASLLIELILIGRELDYREKEEKENLRNGENNITMRCSCVGWGVFPLISLGKNAKLIRGLFSVPIMRGEADLKLSSYREFQSRLFSQSHHSLIMNQTSFLGNMIIQTGVCESNDSNIELPRFEMDNDVNILGGSGNQGEKLLASLSSFNIIGQSVQSPKNAHILDVASSYIPLPKDVLESQFSRTMSYLKSAFLYPCFVNKRSLEIFFIIVLFLLSYCVSNMMHYGFGLMALSSMNIHYNYTVSPVYGWVKYNQDLLTTIGNLGFIISGPAGVLILNIVIAAISVGFGALAKKNKNSYKMRTLYYITLVMFVFSFADPILTVIKNALVNAITPQYRTSYEILYAGSDVASIFIPIIVYVVYELVVLLLFYVYATYFHNNGELGDVTERVSGRNNNFIFPYNDEVSLLEVYQAATEAQQYRGPSGERRKILVIEGENNVRSFTYLGIYNISTSGVRRVYRQFIKEDGRFREIHRIDPAIMEIVRKVERTAKGNHNNNNESKK